MLGEKLGSWIEYAGVALMLITVSIYLVQTRKWMDHMKEESEISEATIREEEEFENEELEIEDT